MREGETDARRRANVTVSCNEGASFVGKVVEVLRAASDGWTGKRPKLGYLRTHVEEAVEWMKHGIREDDVLCGTVEHVAASYCRRMRALRKRCSASSATDHHLHHHSKSIRAGAADLHGAASGGGG